MEIWVTHHCFGAEYRGERAQARPLTQGPVREAVHELQVGREGEDVEEVEEDVHSHDGPHVEQGIDSDVLHLIVLAPELSGAHLQGGTNQGGAEAGTGWAAFLHPEGWSRPNGDGFIIHL